LTFLGPKTRSWAPKSLHLDGIDIVDWGPKPTGQLLVQRRVRAGRQLVRFDRFAAIAAVQASLAASRLTTDMLVLAEKDVSFGAASLAGFRCTKPLAVSFDIGFDTKGAVEAIATLWHPLAVKCP
jgi:hypothetical protein